MTDATRERELAASTVRGRWRQVGDEYRDLRHLVRDEYRNLRHLVCATILGHLSVTQKYLAQICARRRETRIGRKRR